MSVFIVVNDRRIEVPDDDPRAQQVLARRDASNAAVAGLKSPLDAARELFMSLPVETQAYYQDETNRILIALEQNNIELATHNLMAVQPRNDDEAALFLSIVEALGMGDHGDA